MYLMQGMKEMRKEITDNVKVYFGFGAYSNFNKWKKVKKIS